VKDDPIIYDHLGDIYFSLDRKEDALRQWHKSLKIDPQNEKVLEKIKKSADE
jgi:hypothetical protein